MVKSVSHLRAPPTCATPALYGSHRYDATSLTPRAEIVDQLAAVRGRVFLLLLDDLLHDDIKATMAFDGVTIGIRDGLTEFSAFGSRH